MPLLWILFGQFPGLVVKYGRLWPVEYDTTWYGMVRYGMIWYSTIWKGMVWYCVVWHKMVWYSMVGPIWPPPPQAKPTEDAHQCLS